MAKIAPLEQKSKLQPDGWSLRLVKLSKFAQQATNAEKAALEKFLNHNF